MSVSINIKCSLSVSINIRGSFVSFNKYQRFFFFSFWTIFRIYW